MKVILDPVMTNDPGHCASTVKMLKLVQATLAARDDVYFYWLVPAEGSSHHKGMDWYPQHERIKYVPYPYNRDRMREYLRLDRSYEKLVSFWGELWDAEVIVTNRTSLVPFIKMMTLKTGRTNLIWSKRVFLIEDMPIMSFKKKLGLSEHTAVQDRSTLAGYLAADCTAISAFWEKDLILREARTHLTPALVRQIDQRMIETTAVKVEDPGLKTKAIVERIVKREKPFTAAYIGRMVASSRANEIFQLMQKSWIIRGNDKHKVQFLASTQSQTNGRINVPDFVDIKKLPREGFWDLCREEIDVYLFMSKEEDYSMSLIEPLTLGCPAILIRADWSVPTVGAEYPFFVNNFTEAYGLLRAFYDDYPTQYRKFVEWSRTHFKALLHERNKVYVPDVFVRFLAGVHEDQQRAIADRLHVKNEVVQLLVKEAAGKTIVLKDDIERLQDEKKLDFLAMKFTDKFRDRVVNAWQTDWYILKMGLMSHGYRDSSAEPGTFAKVAA